MDYLVLETINKAITSPVFVEQRHLIERVECFCCFQYKVVVHLACVASVSVWFQSKEIPRKRTVGFDRARNETRAKK